MRNISEIPIVLHTMDSYSNYWNPWYTLLQKYLHNHGEIIFLSEEKEPDFIREVRHIKTGKAEWGERLLIGLGHIDSDLIFYMQEDFWATSDLVLTADILSLFYQYNMIQLHIKNKERGQGIIYDNVYENLYKMGQTSSYSQNHQFALWNKDTFKNNILPNETPWQNEIQGTLRMNENPHNIYLLEHDWYIGACRRGQLTKDGEHILLNENLKF